jgi:hypothetical protein
MFLDIIHRPVEISKQRFGDWILSPEMGTSSIDWAQLSRFCLTAETEPTLRNVVLKYKEDGVFR